MCRTCGRGITFVRVARDAAWVVFRWIQKNKGKPRLFEMIYCGRCFFDERHEHQDGDTYMILLGDDEATQRDRMVDMEVA